MTPTEDRTSACEVAADEAVAEWVRTANVVDLREGIAPELRASGRTAASTPALGCPCGCGETELLVAARAGDDRALDELLHRYRALARAKARSYFLVGADRDDVVQEAMIGLYKAVRDFSPDGGASFRGFAEMCVTRQLVDAVKSATRHKHAPLSRSVSLDKPVRGDDGDQTLGDVLPVAAADDPESLAISADEVRALKSHLDEVLSDLEQQVLRHHVQGKSYDEIAAMLQRHVKSIDNALQRIKRKLAAHLDERDVEPV